MDAMDFNIRGINYYENDDGCWQNDIVDVVTRSLESNKFLMNDIDPLLSSSEEEEKLIKSDPEFNNLDAWMTKSVEEWSPKDVLSWISSEAQYFGVMIHEMHGHNFCGIDGYKLKHMSEDDFTTLSSGFGPSLYFRFQEMRLSKDRAFDQFAPIVTSSACDDLWAPKFENNNEHDQFSMRNIYDENTINGNRAKNVFVPDMENSSDSGIETELPTTTPIIKRKPGRPKGSRRKKKPEKLGRLWEFIRDLLLNADYCPSLICWDNYEEGMFRFVHSDKVAKLWGSKKDNPEMNYEKLSRAMRYYYKSRVLLPVYGRRLVYKFGPTATGWRTSNPNFRRRG